MHYLDVFDSNDLDRALDGVRLLERIDFMLSVGLTGRQAEALRMMIECGVRQARETSGYCRARLYQILLTARRLCEQPKPPAPRPVAVCRSDQSVSMMKQWDSLSKSVRVIDGKLTRISKQAYALRSKMMRQRRALMVEIEGLAVRMRHAGVMVPASG